VYEFLAGETGRSLTGSINVAWQLMDVDETDGGFVYLPGGHKASVTLPAPDPPYLLRSMLAVLHLILTLGDDLT
jgi:hypothetical protein